MVKLFEMKKTVPPLLLHCSVDWRDVELESHGLNLNFPDREAEKFHADMTWRYVTRVYTFACCYA